MLWTVISKRLPYEIQQNRSLAGYSTPCCWLYSYHKQQSAKSVKAFYQKRKILQCPNIPTIYVCGQTAKMKPHSGWAPKLASWFQQKLRKLLPKFSCVQTHHVIYLKTTTKSHQPNNRGVDACNVGWIANYGGGMDIFKAEHSHSIPSQNGSAFSMLLKSSSADGCVHT